MENKKLESMSLDFESSMRYMVQKSNQRAWIVAFFSVIVAVLSVIAVCLLTPLKTVEPYVVRVDNTTGMVDIITTINNKSLSMPEAVDKHFINTYVKAREGYYYDVLDKDYVLTQLLSNADVAAEYRSIYEGENARNKKLGNIYKVEVSIISIALEQEAKSATIRIALNTKKQNEEVSKKNATINLNYKYYPTSQMNEKDRLDNPLGFQVTSYRIDEEISQWKKYF